MGWDGGGGDGESGGGGGSGDEHPHCPRFEYPQTCTGLSPES